MTPEQHDELVRQITELRQESLIQRRLLMFISACIAVLLFFPRVAAFIAERSARIMDIVGNELIPVVAMLVVILFAAVIVSHITSKRSAHEK